MKSGRGAEGSSAAAKEAVPRAPVALKKGPWTAEEDAILREYVKKHGEGNWNSVQKNRGLNRCGKSCRLRWTNHLRPNLKKGAFSPEEELLILHLHAKFGNKWARMSTYLPGRTDNEIKNYWNTRLKRRQRWGLPSYPLEMHREYLVRHGYHLHPSANSSSASPVPAPPPPPPPPPPLPLPLPPTLPPAPAPALPAPLREPITLPSSPSPATAAAFSPSLPLLSQNQFSSGLSFQFPLSSPPSPLSLALAQQLSVSCPASLSLQSPLLQPQLQQPLPYSLGSFDLNPPPCFTQMPFTGELPSSQMLGETGGGSSSDCFDILRSSGRTGLLDDVVWEAQRLRVDLPSELVPAAGGRDGNWHGNLGGNGDVSKGSTFSPAQGSVLESFSKPDGSDYSINGIKMKSEATNKISPAHGDIATLFNMILAPTVPATTVVPTMPATMVVALDRHNSDSGEISNGPSSVVTDDDMGLDMHQLTSSYVVAPKEQEWVINPSTWNDMSGIR